MLERVKKYIQEEIWNTNLQEKPKVYSFLIKQLRIIILAFKGFSEDRIAMRASALTYYTLLSVVPIAAMAFGVAKGFGFQNKMEDFIIQNFKGQEEVMNWIIDMSFNVLNDVQGGLLAGIGMVILIWSVMQVLTNIEGSFNAIWQIKQPRAFFRKLSDYLSIMLIGPFLIILSSTLMVYVTTRVQETTGSMEVFQAITPFLEVLFRFIPFTLIWLLLTLIYIIMPNTKVNFKYALIAGIIAGTLFQITQWAYIHFQIGVSKYSALYGTFAALPLFLVWLQISWLIVLLGAEISFAYQNVSKFEFESESTRISPYNRRILALLITSHVVKNFEEEQNPLIAEELAEDLGIPLRLVRDILYDLSTARIITETITDSPREKGYQPATDINKISLQFVNSRLDRMGSENLIVRETKSFEKLNELYDGFYKMLASSPNNKLLKDI